MIHDLSTLEGQRAHYAAVRARLTVPRRAVNLALVIKARINRDAQRRDATYRMIARREARETRLRLESERLARIAERVDAGEVFVPRITIREIAQQVAVRMGRHLRCCPVTIGPGRNETRTNRTDFARVRFPCSACVHRNLPICVRQ